MENSRPFCEFDYKRQEAVTKHQYEPAKSMSYPKNSANVNFFKGDIVFCVKAGTRKVLMVN